MSSGLFLFGCALTGETSIQGINSAVGTDVGKNLIRGPHIEVVDDVAPLTTFIIKVFMWLFFICHAGSLPVYFWSINHVDCHLWVGAFSLDAYSP